MKQIIEKYPNGKISNKYYINDSGQKHGLEIYYYINGGIMNKFNWDNGEWYGLWCGLWVDKSLNEQTYYL